MDGLVQARSYCCVRTFAPNTTTGYTRTDSAIDVKEEEGTTFNCFHKESTNNSSWDQRRFDTKRGDSQDYK